MKQHDIFKVRKPQHRCCSMTPDHRIEPFLGGDDWGLLYVHIFGLASLYAHFFTEDVAVAGLPKAIEDHAIVMALFANDCLSVFNELVKDMEITLGPDTGGMYRMRSSISHVALQIFASA